ncbi:hypothetical protein [Cetobacterium sp.]
MVNNSKQFTFSVKCSIDERKLVSRLISDNKEYGERTIEVIIKALELLKKEEK